MELFKDSNAKCDIDLTGDLEGNEDPTQINPHKHDDNESDDDEEDETALFALRPLYEISMFQSSKLISC